MANFKSARKYHFIYKTTCTLNDKYYIGMHSTNKLDDGYVGSGKRLWYSIRKYGIENFKCEILEFLPDRDSLANRERELVNEEMLKDSNCLNLKTGGFGGFSIESAKKGRRHADIILEQKYGNDYRTILNKKYWNKIHSDETLLLEHSNKVKAGLKKSGFDHKSFKGKKHTDETKKKMSESSKGTGTGKHNSQFGTCWITNGIENKKIKKEELNNFSILGWRMGRIFL